jgi:hypothetical protein
MQGARNHQVPKPGYHSEGVAAVGWATRIAAGRGQEAEAKEHRVGY